MVERMLVECEPTIMYTGPERRHPYAGKWIVSQDADNREQWYVTSPDGALCVKLTCESGLVNDAWCQRRAEWVAQALERIYGDCVECAYNEEIS